MPTPVPSHHAIPRPGAVLAGKHRIVRVLGEGGMGVVLEAEHVLSGKRVAIKWLHPSSQDPSQAFGRMLREAQSAARVRHPNVVDVYDVSADGSSMFLVMELLEGETLAALLARGSVPIHSLIALLIEAMRGVAEAHRQRVIHRDIKPENIFLVRHRDREQPTPKVLDFGISKLVEPGTLSLTRTGDALGTPLYMSAEQLRGVRDLDARADVYAFGVILYEALTGRPPYEAETLSDLIVQLMSSPPPSPKSLRPELPSALDQVVQRAVMPDRERRTPSMEALIAELAPFAVASSAHGLLSSSTTLPRAARASRSRSIGGRALASTTTLDAMRPRVSKVLLAGFAVVLLAAVAWLAWPHATERTTPVAAPAPQPVPTVAAPQLPKAAPAPAVAPAAAPPEVPPATRGEPVPARKGTKAAHARDHTRSARSHADEAPVLAPAASAPAAPAAPATPAATDAPPTPPSSPAPRLRAGRPQREEF